MQELFVKNIKNLVIYFNRAESIMRAKEARGDESKNIP